jgi:hypothetical protein
MKYEYNPYNEYYTNQLHSQTYGNYDSIKFDYDDEDRITDIYFKDKDATDYVLRFHYELILVIF